MAVITGDHWIPGFKIDWRNTFETFPLQAGNIISHKTAVLQIKLCFAGPPWCIFRKPCLFACTCVSINSKNLFKGPVFFSENSLHLKSPKSRERHGSYIWHGAGQGKQAGWMSLFTSCPLVFISLFWEPVDILATFASHKSWGLPSDCSPAQKSDQLPYI